MAKRPRLIFSSGLEGILDLHAGLLKLEGKYLRFDGVLSHGDVEYRMPRKGDTILFRRPWEREFTPAVVAGVSE
jgi:hypothetical protein